MESAARRTGQRPADGHVSWDPLWRLKRLRRADAKRVDWFPLYLAARLLASLLAFVIVSLDGLVLADWLLLLYGPLSTAALAAAPRLRQMAWVRLLDPAVGLALIVISGQEPSPYYLLWLTTLVLPATSLPTLDALWLALAAAVDFLLSAILTGPDPRALSPASSATVAVCAVLPFVLVTFLAHAAGSLPDEHDSRD
jgi:hypothetical protein